MGQPIYEGYARFPGVVRDGRIVLADDVRLEDGTEVEVVVVPIPFTPEEQAEFEGWDHLSAEGWVKVDEMLKESGRATG